MLLLMDKAAIIKLHESVDPVEIAMIQQKMLSRNNMDVSKDIEQA